MGGVYAAVAIWTDVRPSDALPYAMALIVAESLIWFPEQLGSVTGIGGIGNGISRVDTETPGCMVTLFGWLMLVAMPLIRFGT